MKHSLRLDFETDAFKNPEHAAENFRAKLVLAGCKHITVTNLPVEQAGEEKPSPDGTPISSQD